MNIINTDLHFNTILTKRKTTNKIILHHSASAKTTPLSIHQAHLRNGWSGIGYHYLVAKDGKVYSGRPYDTVGAHCTGQNADSIGICFEGNFEIEEMTDTQIKAGQELMHFLKIIYGKNIRIAKHMDYMATACPGKNFPFSEFSRKMEGYTGTFPTLPSRGYFTKGDKGKEVAKMKKFLNWYGNYGLSTHYDNSNKIGNNTVKAIIDYQKKEGLVADGLFGRKSLDRALECIK